MPTSPTPSRKREFISVTLMEMRPHILSVILLMVQDGELRAMRWRNLEEERDLYHVRETHSRKHGFTTTKTASSEAEVRRVSLHTLRKTGALILESLGVTRAETQEALRHKRPTVTAIYVSVYMEQPRKHMEEVAALLTGDPPFPQSSLKVG